jgi:hypothetical protein
MYSGPDTLVRVGFPIRTSADQRSLASPRGFSQRATSFFASWRQGIHRTPFSRSSNSNQRPHAGPNRAPHASLSPKPKRAYPTLTLYSNQPFHLQLSNEHPPQPGSLARAQQVAVLEVYMPARPEPYGDHPANAIASAIRLSLFSAPPQQAAPEWRQPDSNR